MKVNPSVKYFSALAVAALLHGSAFGQATRTWVSGVGDDANPGSRTAPCKTFPGAISKTAVGGEISVLDPGGFGTVTITKGITLNGEGTIAGILSSGVNGIVISAGTNDVITLKNLSIKSPGGGIPFPSGLFGVKVLQAGTVILEKCTIEDGSDFGISFQPTNPNAKLVVRDSYITGCAGGGIKVLPAVAGPTASVSTTLIQGGEYGIRVESGATSSITDCAIQGSTVTGVVAKAGGSINMVDTTVSLGSGGGVRSGTNGKISMARCTVTDMLGKGIDPSPLPAEVVSFGNNVIRNNNPNGVFTSTTPLQ